MSEEKNITKIKKYTIEHIEYDDKTVSIRRTNEGFSALELIGIAEVIQLELTGLVMGVVKVDVTERIMIEKRIIES